MSAPYHRSHDAECLTACIVDDTLYAVALLEKHKVRQVVLISKMIGESMDVQPWQRLLRDIIADPRVKAKLASDLGVRPITLTRWATNESQPRPRHLSMLINVLPPEHQKRMAELVSQHYPDVLHLARNSTHAVQAEQIPGDFYASVLDASTKTSKEQAFFTLSHRVLVQMLGQLDPDTVGTAVRIAVCVPPGPDLQVHSLREALGRGTPPWPSTLPQEAQLFGIESLAGYALTQGRTFIAPSRQKYAGLQAVRWETWEESAIACPIQRYSRYAGCLIVSSNQPDYFSAARRTLVENYSNLLALAFAPEDFYDPHNIRLLYLPERELQEQSTWDFRQRLSAMILEAHRAGQSLSLERAERLIWQQLEAEVLDLVVQRARPREQTSAYEKKKEGRHHGT